MLTRTTSASIHCHIIHTTIKKNYVFYCHYHYYYANLNVVAQCYFFWVCDAVQNFSVFSLHHNPGHDSRIYDCFITSMVAI